MDTVQKFFHNETYVVTIYTITSHKMCLFRVFCIPFH